MAQKEPVEEKLEKVRHSLSHVMAEAVLQMFPQAQIAIGPAIDNGFYYDFELPRALSSDDLEEISQRMKTIIHENKEFKRIVVSRDEARKMFAGQVYKLELIEAIPENEEVSLYNQGGFTDLCRGPHVASTKELNAESFKLLNTAGAYWRGKETNPMLTRIYATAWTNPKDLRLYLQKLEEIEKRDHRKLGKELDLFSFHEIAGAGLPLYHPKGARILRLLQEWLRAELYRRGYVEAITPHMYKADVWK
ncbi:MAG: threonine--tRNA ligase, partial [Spirochaetae bacterium HGW-Spirochaetae-8]